jgi:hypothetical protein
MEIMVYHGHALGNMKKKGNHGCEYPSSRKTVVLLSEIY